MGTYRGLSRRARIALVVAVAALAAAGSAAAFQALPPGAQVNDDVAAGINPALNVSGEDPTNADVVGGALGAGKPAVPWSIFRQQEAAGGHDQIFSRSFAGGAWTTRGNGTVGGRSSAAPTFTGSLNFDQGQDGEAPSIDFAGAGRTVPWATWYENTTGTGFGANNVFASRFDATTGKWVFAGQSRGNGGSGPNVPSLNIHTDQSAENPSVAGGSAVDPTKPGPWVTWQETTSSPVNGKDQIFVSKPLGPGMANCDAPVTPAGVMDGTGHVPAIGGFCFQDVGVQRVGPGNADPSLNVDVARDGIEPDIAFTGTNDSVPWVVWYEKGTGTAGLSDKELVFAAKAEADTTAGVNGGFHWHVIGNTGNGILNAANSCAGSLSAEQACSLNSDPTKDAEDVRVAAGTMNPANPTAPWAAWDETVGNVHQVFVSRFVATPSPHFQIVNGGNPISTSGVESTRPDITFSGNTPYVTWREATSGGTKAFVGHFVNAANPTFVLDESDVPLTPTAQADVREPISSTCIATPFNLDGQSCQGGAVGTPFFLFTNGTSPRGLFADAYQPDVPVTGGASGISTSTATVSGTVNPEGAAVKVHFDFGTTTAYGQSTPVQTLGVGNAPAAFNAALNGLPAGTTVHYRAVASSDFGTFAGADQTLTTSSVTTPPPANGTATVGHAKVNGKTVAVRITCSVAPCKLTLRLTAQGRHHHRVGVGSTTVTLQPGQTRIVRISLNRTGRNLLAAHHVLRVKLIATQSLDGGHVQTISTQTVIIKVHAHKHH
ncbi:MAG: hypothetical protein ACTHMY_21590 [Solirubrobacteraceae bacterium]